MRDFRPIGFLVLVVVALMAVDAIGERITYALQALRYPYEIAYGEGQVFLQTERIMAGEAVYAPIVDSNMLPSLYPPMYHVLTAAVSLAVGGEPLSAGRALSYLAMLLLAGGVGMAVWLATPGIAGRWVRACLGLLAALLFWSMEWQHAFAVLMRSDMMANWFAFAGFLVFVTPLKRPGGFELAALFFVAAVFTRHSVVVAPLVCGALLVATSQWRRALVLFSQTVILAIVLLVVTRVTLGSAFLDHMTAVGVHDFDWAQATGLLIELCAEYPLLFGLAILEVAVTLPRLAMRSSEDAEQWPPPRLALSLYFVGALGGALLAGKKGADVNYFIELLAVATCCAMITVARAVGQRGAGPSGSADQVAAVAIPLLLLVQTLIVGRGVGSEFSVPSAAEKRAHDELVTQLGNGPAVSLCEDPILLSRAGREADFLFLEMSELALAGRWDQGRFVDKIERAEYPVIVSRFELSAWAPDDVGIRFRLTREMSAAIAARYDLEGRMGRYVVYRPKP